MAVAQILERLEPSIHRCGSQTLSAADMEHGISTPCHIHMYINNREVLDSRELLVVRFTVDLFIGNVRVRLRIILVRASATLNCGVYRHVTAKDNGNYARIYAPRWRY